MLAAGQAEHWYQSPIFWAVAGVGAVVIVGVAGILVTYIVSTASRHLTYAMPTVTALPGSLSQRPGIELTYQGERITQPRILEIRLTSSGRKDIGSDSFNDRKPLVLDVGAKIVTLLGSTATPEGASPPAVEFRETALLVGPDLIRKGQLTTFTLLADGPAPSLNCQSPLIDVKVARERTATLPPFIEALLEGILRVAPIVLIR
jgi:hypothetical protein